MKTSIFVYAKVYESDSPCMMYSDCTEVEVFFSKLSFLDAQGNRHITTCPWEIIDHPVVPK